MHRADTFDILLYKCSSIGAKICRTYCNSEFDHAAMVLKFAARPDEVFLIESTSNFGVTVKNFLGHKRSIGGWYEKVVLRHLEWDRTDESLRNLEKFVKEIRGRAYNFTFDMIRKRQTKNLGRDQTVP